MNNKNRDRRKISGNRVLAKCELVLPVSNPFAYFEDNVKTGHVVLNVSGGCLYLRENFAEEYIDKLFPDGQTTVFEKFTLYPRGKPEIVIENIKVSYIRRRKEGKREGIVFRFCDITEKHLDTLNSLRFTLPGISHDEESSVPFEEIITLDRNDHFELT